MPCHVFLVRGIKELLRIASTGAIKMQKAVSTQGGPSVLWRYGLALLFVAAALAVALLVLGVLYYRAPRLAHEFVS